MTLLTGPLPPGIMDQLAAAAAAQYVAQPAAAHPGPQPTPQPQQPPPQPPSQPPQLQRAPNVIDAAVQTEVTTVVQSKQVRNCHGSVCAVRLTCWRLGTHQTVHVARKDVLSKDYSGICYDTMIWASCLSIGNCQAPSLLLALEDSRHSCLRWEFAEVKH